MKEDQGADALQLGAEFFEHDTGIRLLANLVQDYESPELIDDRPEQAPSRRITACIPEYSARKASAGPLVVAKIGLPRLRERCPHFDGWVSRLERLDS